MVLKGMKWLIWKALEDVTFSKEGVASPVFAEHKTALEEAARG